MSKCFWQKLPAVRLLIPFIAGVYCQNKLNSSVNAIALFVLSSIISILLYHFFSLRKKFQLVSLAGITLQLIFFACGMLVLKWNETKVSATNTPVGLFTAILDEDPAEKKNSYKATASLYRVNEEATSRILIYFEKDSAHISRLTSGTKFIFSKAPQEIRNSGNPGAFDFRSWCLFQNITHQVYLTSRDLVIAPEKQTALLDEWISQTRQYVLQTIRLCIDGRKEQGLAEALLIGYKHDLDRSLVQAYANTGVVHVIAISGLHLGIIYTILLFFTRPFNRKKLYWLRFLIIIAGLWAFTLLAGAQASVMRSAVMFSFIAAAAVLQRTSNVINTMALSAFLLLAWKPYWLWDVGFQLSYSAVLSIVLFFKPVYNLLYFKTAICDIPWKMTAVTISAQILTLPLTLYYFHQFPLLLLFTNLLAVPLSSLVLVLEIVLMAAGPLQPVASFIGGIIGWLIFFLNYFIEQANAMPVVTWKGIHISWFQVVCLYFFLVNAATWLMWKTRSALPVSLFAVLAFTLARTQSFYQASKQQKLIVYNIPKASAAEIITGRTALLMADSSIYLNPELNSFHILPSRVVHRVEQEIRKPSNSLITVGGEKILFINKGELPLMKENPDIIVISNGVDLPENDWSINKTDIVVLDASVAQWKRKEWKKRFADRDIHIHSVADDGAFVMNF